MQWTVASLFQERQGTSNQIVLHASNNLRLAIVSDVGLNADTVSTFALLTEVATGTGYTGPITCTGVTYARDGANDVVLDMADIAAIAQDAGSGFSDGNNWVLYDSVTDYVIAFSTPDVVPFGNVAGPVDLDIDPLGIYKTTV